MVSPSVLIMYCTSCLMFVRNISTLLFWLTFSVCLSFSSIMWCKQSLWAVCLPLPADLQWSYPPWGLWWQRPLHRRLCVWRWIHAESWQVCISSRVWLSVWRTVLSKWTGAVLEIFERKPPLLVQVMHYWYFFSALFSFLRCSIQKSHVALIVSVQTVG